MTQGFLLCKFFINHHTSILFRALTWPRHEQTSQGLLSLNAFQCLLCKDRSYCFVAQWCPILSLLGAGDGDLYNIQKHPVYPVNRWKKLIWQASLCVEWITVWLSAVFIFYQWTFWTMLSGHDLFFVEPRNGNYYERRQKDEEPFADLVVYGFMPGTQLPSPTALILTFFTIACLAEGESLRSAC